MRAAAEAIVFDGALRLLLMKNGALCGNRGRFGSAEIREIRLTETGHSEVAERPGQHQNGNGFPQYRMHLPSIIRALALSV